MLMWNINYLYEGGILRNKHSKPSEVVLPTLKDFNGLHLCKLSLQCV